MKISARNQLKGKVTSIQEGPNYGIVTLDVGGGNQITSSITMAAIRDLGLTVGKDACAVIKASAVMVGVDG